MFSESIVNLRRSLAVWIFVHFAKNGFIFCAPQRSWSPVYGYSGGYVLLQPHKPKLVGILKSFQSRHGFPSFVEWDASFNLENAAGSLATCRMVGHPFRGWIWSTMESFALHFHAYVGGTVTPLMGWTEEPKRNNEVEDADTQWNGLVEIVEQWVRDPPSRRQILASSKFGCSVVPHCPQVGGNFIVLVCLFSTSDVESSFSSTIGKTPSLGRRPFSESESNRVVIRPSTPSDNYVGFPLSRASKSVVTSTTSSFRSGKEARESGEFSSGDDYFSPATERVSPPMGKEMMATSFSTASVRRGVEGEPFRNGIDSTNGPSDVDDLGPTNVDVDAETGGSWLENALDGFWKTLWRWNDKRRE